MSTFSELNARLAQGLADAVAAIESKNGTVSMANTTPQIEEIVEGINNLAMMQTTGASFYQRFSVVNTSYARMSIKPKSQGILAIVYISQSAGAICDSITNNWMLQDSATSEMS